MIKRFVGVVGLVVFLLGIWGCRGNAETQKQDKDSHPVAPGFVLVDLKGDTVRLADLRGKMVILNFWDTWCGPCRMEIPDFIELYDAYKDKGFMMIGVAGGRLGVENVRQFVEDQGMNYPVVMLTQTLLDDYGPINGIPTTFVIDREGRIVKKYVGYRPKQVFQEDIQTLLGE